MKTLAPEERLYNLGIPVIGLTGGIATGKSTVSKLLMKEGVPLIDADQLVKDVYALDETKAFIQAKHPEAWKSGAVHFPTLREKFFKDSTAKGEIEKFIYARLPDAFSRALAKLGSPRYVVYDVPLLFEKDLADKVDLTVLVYAPRKIQIARLKARDGHLEEMAETILKHQLDIEEKKRKADYIIDNSVGMTELEVEVQNLHRQILAKL